MVPPFEIYPRTSRLKPIEFRTMAEIEGERDGRAGLDSTSSFTRLG